MWAASLTWLFVTCLLISVVYIVALCSSTNTTAFFSLYVCRVPDPTNYGRGQLSWPEFLYVDRRHIRSPFSEFRHSRAERRNNGTYRGDFWFWTHMTEKYRFWKKRTGESIEILRNCLFNSTIKQRAYSRKDLQHMYIVLKHFCRTLGQTGIKSFACFVWLHEWTRGATARTKRRTLRFLIFRPYMRSTTHIDNHPRILSTFREDSWEPTKCVYVHSRHSKGRPSPHPSTFWIWTF
jgi:hypothetical protein